MIARPDIEQRVLAELLCNPEALALAADLEVRDLSDARHRFALSAIRELQAAECAVDICDVADIIALRDVELGTHAAESASLPFLTDMVANAETYGDLLTSVFPADLRQLRLIANERRL